MGYGSLIGQGMIIYAILIISAILLSNYQDYSINSLAHLESNKNQNQIEQKGSISIIDSNISTTSLNLTIKNTGKIKIKKISEFEVYLNGIRIEDSNKYIYSVASYDLVNPGILDIKEIINIETNGSFESGNHSIAVSSGEGIKDQTFVFLP